ncbi:hypothetical protein PI23P_06970 [Polaribacter irgensii 23-P]|uniref:Chromosome segregation protein n=1 Tax=Polaribacter irgensii 23-P TaxID=313594 RepID=A4BYV3_9FLAO|nr:DUF349 domain-containing protein [Polaribacter irgensii]EAR12346.1 hypothetical protein PI23P_06970 [Polaribacter irgensii 23-P]
MLDTNEENVEKTVNKNETTAKETSKEKEEKPETIEAGDVVADGVIEIVEETVAVVEDKVAVVADLVVEETKEIVKEKEEGVVLVSEEVTLEVVEAVADVPVTKKEIEKEADPEVALAVLSLEELVEALQNTLSNNPVNKIKERVDLIKNAFNKKFGVLLAENKAAFLEAGGNAIDFQYSTPVKGAYNALLSEYKKKRDAHYNSIEKQMDDNLDTRMQVIEGLKDLIDNGDANTMYKDFKVLQDTWRSIGAVSKTRYNDTWKTYHHHVERFYDLLHLSNDFRDLDFKNNLEEKLKIILTAEALVEVVDVNEAFKQLQDLHKIWKEDIGPVAKEVREDVWQKFSAATKKIHDRRHEHFREMKSKYQEIINDKLAIVAHLDGYDTSKNNSHKAWRNSIDDVEKLRQEYFNVGKLPYAKSEEVWLKFKAATKKFNSAKNNFYKEEKSEQQDNLKKKLSLIEIAESLKESEDWNTATEAMKKVQSDWKHIGHVPRKFSDDIWTKFKAACNAYFDRYHEQKNAISNEQQAVVDAKKVFLEAIKEEKTHTKETVLEAIDAWKELGPLPRDVRHLEGKFNKQIDRLLEGLSLGKKEVSMLKFVNVVDGLFATEDFRKLDSEQLLVRKKMDEVVKEVQQLENNLGFFSNAKDDNPLVLNVKNRVQEFKEDLEIWKEKLRYLRKLDY